MTSAASDTFGRQPQPEPSWRMVLQTRPCYIFISTCPRISPEGNFLVCRLRYHFPAARSAAWASESVEEPFLIGTIALASKWRPRRQPICSDPFDDYERVRMLKGEPCSQNP